MVTLLLRSCIFVFCAVKVIALTACTPSETEPEGQTRHCDYLSCRFCLTELSGYPLSRRVPAGHVIHAINLGEAGAVVIYEGNHPDFPYGRATRYDHETVEGVTVYDYGSGADRERLYEFTLPDPIPESGGWVSKVHIFIRTDADEIDPEITRIFEGIVPVDCMSVRQGAVTLYASCN